MHVTLGLPVASTTYKNSVKQARRPNDVLASASSDYRRRQHQRQQQQQSAGGACELIPSNDVTASITYIPYRSQRMLEAAWCRLPTLGQCDGISV